MLTDAEQFHAWRQRETGTLMDKLVCYSSPQSAGDKGKEAFQRQVEKLLQEEPPTFGSGLVLALLHNHQPYLAVYPIEEAKFANPELKEYVKAHARDLANIPRDQQRAVIALLAKYLQLWKYPDEGAEPLPKE